ncbi:MAG TPA: D-alanine--D-alanine ligase family protein [Polyangiaceae bacterium]|nr:D-alanine--D-alanine ligase family protein [Polyangiaceae bacterium]
MSADRPTVLVLYGGRSAEHEISILSARFVVSALERYRPLLVAIGRDGRWHLQKELPEMKDPRDARIDENGKHVWLEPMPARGLHVEGGEPMPFDVAFPVLHGPMGEDGTVQGLLELAGIPYVGSGVVASALGMDKHMQKQVLAQAGVPVVPFVALRRSEWREKPTETTSACNALGYPLFVKPSNMGSSLGIRKVTEHFGLAGALEHAFGFDTRVIVERGLTGAREIEISILGNDDPRASVAGEIVVEHPDGFYSYDAKYIDDGANLRVPAALTDAERSRIERTALAAYRALDCAGMARVDMFLHDDRVYLNEVNTIPGFTSISMYPMLWRASGIEAPELVHRLIELALERHKTRAALRTQR